MSQRYNPLIQLDNIGYIKNSKPLLANISFQVRKNEIITIVGKNGAGKTTLCKTLIGIIKPSTGKIIKQDGLKISYIPQINDHNVLVPIRVKDFILLNSKKKLETADFGLIQQLNLENSLNKLFKDLSGGEKQKVMLLRALLLCPDIIILDEPASNIDFSSREDMYSLINEYKGKNNFSVIMVSHDLHMVLKNTDWVLCLNEGKIGCSGVPSVVNENEILKTISSNYKYYNHKD
ncbi:MAG: metal ABC transporter ATP-binding protein [Alphaproteobacteria bacterium]|jgi:zinc transport system ATP-binding protein|nr:metal ABC transporter ATP-binding protein [Alphaproteobacteria bacterium]